MAVEQICRGEDMPPPQIGDFFHLEPEVPDLRALLAEEVSLLAVLLGQPVGPEFVFPPSC